MNLGKGSVGVNTVSHVIMGGLNLFLGLILGSAFGARGVAYGFAVALSLGSSFLIGMYHKRTGVRRGIWRARENAWLVGACLSVGFFGWYEADLFTFDDRCRIAGALLLPAIAIGLAAWFHPVRSEIWLRLTVR
jgi:hypothetical protein